MTGGTFITFEGIEGCGKSTQIELLAARLQRAGVAPVVTREPGGTELGRRLRAVLLNTDAPPIGALSELLLYATDRAQHLEQLVLPALEQGRVVLSDRYVDATLAYQGFGRELGTETIRRIHREPPLNRLPERTILLDLEPVVAVNRARQRNRDEGCEATEGRFEQEQLAFHERVRRGYLELAGADPGRIRVVPAVGDRASVARRVATELAELLPAAGPD